MVVVLLSCCWQRMCECRSGRILNGLNGSSQTVAARVPDSRLVLSTATCNQSAILCGRLMRCAALMRETMAENWARLYLSARQTSAFSARPAAAFFV